jgi:hypothetical protein
MKYRTNLPQPHITKILKTLEARKLVKSVKNVNNPSRKVISSLLATLGGRQKHFVLPQAAIILGCSATPCQLVPIVVVSHLKWQWHKGINNLRLFCNALPVVAGRCCVAFKMAQMHQ